MPRLRYITESEKTPAVQKLISSSEARGAPDPRVVSIMAEIHILYCRQTHQSCHELSTPGRRFL